MTLDAHAEVVAFLGTPEAHGLPPGSTVETVRTHGALIYLAGQEAVKLKRAVRYDYMDLSTVDQRHALLDRELALNLPYAPSIYRDVVPVVRTAAGLRIGGDGDPVEWILRMNRFPAGNELDRIVRAGEMDGALAARTGVAVAEMHRQSKISDLDGATIIGEIVDELDHVLPDLNALSDGEVAALLDHLRTSASANRDLLRDRALRGFVRRCHGDLHLRNMVLIDGKPTPFDALEFDERLGTCDILYDLAFLIMDLLQEDAPAQACRVLDGWLGAMRDGSHETGLALFPLFLSLRATIRAMTECQSERPDAARAYLSAARKFLDPAPPRLVAVGGLSGSGKTILARSIAPQFGAAPGALHIRTDVERKALYGVRPTDHLPVEAYANEVNDRVYAVIYERARRALFAGHSVILDAAFLDEGERFAARDMARDVGVPFDGLWIEAPEEVLRHRIAERHDDASDADHAVLKRQIARRPEPQDWHRIANTGTVAQGAERCLAVLLHR